MPRAGQRHGRILPHQRDTNDEAPVLGSELLAIENYAEDVHETLSLEISDGVRKDYRRRIRKIIEYWKENFGEYHFIGVRQLSEEEINDKTKFYFGRFKEDIVYTGINI